MSNAFEYVVKSIQPAVDAIAADLVDVEFPDGTVLENIRMIPPKDRSEATDDSGITIEIVMRKFTVAASDLGREPEFGMMIAWRGQRYRSVNDAGEKCWDWQDHYKLRYVIHTELAPTIAGQQVAYGNQDGVIYGNQDTDGVGYGSTPR